MTFPDAKTQEEILLSITMDQIIDWIMAGEEGKDLTKVDDRKTTERIASSVWFAIHRGSRSQIGHPELFINPGTHEDHDPNTSLLAFVMKRDAELGRILAEVLKAWAAHMEAELRKRVLENLGFKADAA